jgi:hypothetical protein
MSAHAVSPSYASGVVALVTGSDSIVRAFLPLILALRLLVLILQTRLPLASGAALRLHSLVVPWHPEIGLRSFARHRLQHRRQGPL